MKKSVAIIGGGPAAFAAAAFLDPALFNVTIYEKNKSLGRKFLVAGKGGFNLTHSEEIEAFKSRYSPTGFLDAALTHFTNHDFRNWLAEIGTPTFVGSSKRVYPEKGIKPIAVLNRIIECLVAKGVQFEYEHEWINWDENNNLVFTNDVSISPDIILFALGGGSWKVTGSDGSWLDIFSKKGIQTVPFRAENCGFQVDWKPDFLIQNVGVPIKNCTFSCGGKHQTGEVVITEFGLEGNAIYALSSEIQSELTSKGRATIYIDFKPGFSESELQIKLENSDANTTQALKRTLKLSPTQIALLKSNLTKEEFTRTAELAKRIKNFPIHLTAAAHIDEAISTSGGIALDEVDENFELKSLPSSFCIGEMLDWNAPTGGYLLQGCFSMGDWTARSLNERV